MNNSSFPAAMDGEAFALWRGDRDRWQAAVLVICARERLVVGTPVAFPTGTNLVVALDERLVLKVFPPIFRSQFEAEVATLAQLAGRLTFAIPAIVARGEIEGWSYLCMTRLEGVVGSEVWPRLDDGARRHLLVDIGQTISAVQAVPPGPIGRGQPDWRRFIERQIDGCRARHQARGLGEKHLDDLDGILADARSVIAREAPAVILTGEYIPENFLLAQRNGRWEISGLFDFGDVMTGPADYDLLGPSAFMAAGRADLVSALLSGFGYGAEDLDEALRRRLFTLMLLHRASDLRNVAIAGWEEKVDHLADLAGLIWPAEDGVTRR